MTPPARWLLPETPPQSLRSLTRDLSISPIVARVLWQRGYRDRQSAHQFLSAPLDALHDPFLMKGMAEAVDRLNQAISRGEKVLLYGDYDVDGATSIVILKKALEPDPGDKERRARLLAAIDDMDVTWASDLPAAADLIREDRSR